MPLCSLTNIQLQNLSRASSPRNVSFRSAPHTGHDSASGVDLQVSQTRRTQQQLTLCLNMPESKSLSSGKQSTLEIYIINKLKQFKNTHVSSPNVLPRFEIEEDEGRPTFCHFLLQHVVVNVLDEALMALTQDVLFARCA